MHTVLAAARKRYQHDVNQCNYRCRACMQSRAGSVRPYSQVSPQLQTVRIESFSQWHLYSVALLDRVSHASCASHLTCNGCNGERQKPNGSCFCKATLFLCRVPQAANTIYLWGGSQAQWGKRTRIMRTSNIYFKSECKEIEVCPARSDFDLGETI